MDKNKFCEELKKKGYEASIDSGVVMVKKSGKVEELIKEVKTLADKLGYNESLGVRTISAATAAPVKKNEEMEDEYFDEDDSEEYSEENDKSTVLADVNASDFEQMNLFDML